MELDELTLKIRVSAEEADQELASFCESLRAIDEPARAANAALGAVIGAAHGLASAAAGEGLLRNAMSETAVGYRQSADAATRYQSAVEGIERQAKRLASDASERRRAARQLSDMQRVIAAYKKGEAAQGAYEKTLKTLSERFGLTGLSADEAQAHIASMSRALASDMDSAQSEADGLLSALYGVEAASLIAGSVTVDTSGAHAALAALSQEAQALLSVLSALGVASSSGGGGGGGGGKRKSAYQKEIEDLEHLIAVGKSDTRQTLMALSAMEYRYAKLSADDRRDLEERLYEAKEALRKEELTAALDAIDHRVAMEEIGAREEIALLEKVKAAHQLTAQERMALDEKLYDARRALISDAAGRIDALDDGTQQALTNRYQQMLDGELGAIEKSREAWRAWGDEAASALDRQIAALDALTQSEDRQAQDEKELRNIEKLRAQIAYEQDAYNRAMLTKQLDSAIETRMQRLRRQESEDEKKALREQLTLVQEKTDAELRLLDEKEAATQAAYDARMSLNAIRAESERLVAKGDQEALLQLIGDYAPEYDAVGRTLGERLAQGFQDGLDGLEDWFSMFHGKLLSVRADMDAISLSAADAFYAQRTPVNVSQTNVFNTPVESPAETVRKIANANAALGEQIMASL